ncbi:ArsJ-associated glyceraldehyde-3-phosphate dehydrogenase [Synechococcus sp. AH-551-A21]|nr:ArsJ-associated glyceraldehyde-3-phosphate dehydrogenase [Synechococcus sp. AH-551-A21]MDB4678062.1 ArsJ-associated glyceraldehyde-3-phosphate dehydrogenase [Synechococcus sp. AH-551-A21]
MRIGINGFGRIGRLVLRALWGRSGIEIVHVNDCAGDAVAAAHLLQFDSVHGRWQHEVRPDSMGFLVEDKPVRYSSESDPTNASWSESGVEMLLECSGKFKTSESLQLFLDVLKLKRILVACPVKGSVGDVEILNIVYGINHQLYDPNLHKVVTAASCTTNCLAPIVKVVHNSFGIKHGSITTLHDVTNTQVVVDGFHNNLRRARSCIQSVIPTTTGSAKAIGLIFPELEGKLNGHAVRIPLLNASLTDAVFELEKKVSIEDVNGAFEAAANGELHGILGYETRPLVSVDYVNDSRSTIVDALSTMVINSTQIKVYAWYDNEWGYSSRMADLACHVARLEE